MKKKVIIIIICGILMICFLIIMYYNYLESKPLVIFQRKFNFSLPKSVKVINYNFKFAGEENLYLKASFDEGDFEYIEENLDIYFKGEIKNDPYYIYHDYVFKDEHPWWDMNENKLISSYYTITFGKRAKSRSVFVYITIDESGQHYLYVIH